MITIIFIILARVNAANYDDSLNNIITGTHMSSYDYYFSERTEYHVTNNDETNRTSRRKYLDVFHDAGPRYDRKTSSPTDEYMTNMNWQSPKRSFDNDNHGDNVVNEGASTSDASKQPKNEEELSKFTVTTQDTPNPDSNYQCHAKKRKKLVVLTKNSIDESGDHEETRSEEQYVLLLQEQQSDAEPSNDTVGIMSSKNQRNDVIIEVILSDDEA
ncbi:hypothetical protein THOM_2717 [Trachipleistophora hominis]|uniref:Uncharacterized protein n=1 Tax=Trachipleistophora hominis TaxID=72359 RepID=L7JSE7_TRAHO|nr:hypothetical protein THOM_2717 [Trachipleistophora hominis]